MRNFFFASLTLALVVLAAACSKNSVADTLTPTTTTAKLINTVPANVTDLPQAALDYIAANYPNATITSVEKGFETDINAGAFGVHLSDGTELIFDLAGKFIEAENHDGDGDDHHDDSDSTDVDNDHNDNVVLPAAAQAWLDANLPGATVEEAKTETLCDGTVAIEVEVKQGQTKTKIAFLPDGTLLFTEVKIAATDMPQAVKDAAAAQFPTGTLKNKATRLDYADGSVRYEAEVKIPNAPDWEAIFLADGTLVCKSVEDDD